MAEERDIVPSAYPALPASAPVNSYDRPVPSAAEIGTAVASAAKTVPPDESASSAAHDNAIRFAPFLCIKVLCIKVFSFRINSFSKALLYWLCETITIITNLLYHIPKQKSIFRKISSILHKMIGTFCAKCDVRLCTDLCKEDNPL